MAENFTLNKISFSGDLTDPVFFDNVALFVAGIVDSNSGLDCRRALNDLEQLVNRNSRKLGEYNEKYAELIKQLRFGCLSLLTDKEMEEVLSTNVSEAFRDQHNLIESFSKIFWPEFTEKDYSKIGLFVRFLQGNRELIGNINIPSDSGQVLMPTISNWLQDYRSSITEDSGPLNIATYFSKRPNLSQMSDSDKSLLRYVFNFYDWLRFRASKTKLVIEDGSVAESRPKPSPKPQISAPRPTNVSTPKPVPSAFDQKLSQISTPAPAPASTRVGSAFVESTRGVHGEGLEALRQRMQANKISFEPGPKQAPVAVPPPATLPVKMNPQEIKREINTPELSAPSAVKPATPIRPIEPPKPREIIDEPVLKLRTKVETNQSFGMRTAPSAMPAPMSLHSLNDIKVVEDLKKIEVGHLRLGAIQTQIQMIRSKILSLAQANRLLPYYTVLAFEASPLFKTYLKHGSDMVQGLNSNQDLNQAEFEAVADLRKEIERL